MTVQLSLRSQELTVDWSEHVCILRFTGTGRSVNTLTRTLLDDLGEVLGELHRHSQVRGLVLASDKPGCFLAGADLALIESMKTEEEAESGARALQDLFFRVERAAFPVVAAIEGLCLGGGLELALACHNRLCANTKPTRLGLPEVKLGLIPGAGGTQRLPRLLGLGPALDLILTGRTVDPTKALKMGLVDDVLPANQLVDAAVSACLRRIPHPVPKRPSWEKALENIPGGSKVIQQKTASKIRQQSHGHYPAPLAALEATCSGFRNRGDAGFAHEARAFAQAATSSASRALLHVFRASNATKQPLEESTGGGELLEGLKRGERPIGILGAGLMGAGIATVLAESGIRTVLMDSFSPGLEKGVTRIRDHFSDQVARRRVNRQAAEAAVGRIHPTMSHQGLRGSPLIIEAVFEDLEIKRNLLHTLEETIPREFVFATNTSSIPIADIAKGSRHPERVVGMHFFSPVPKMPLVEIIRGPETSPDALSRVFSLARGMGKTVIVVNDGPGFYTTRVLGFMLAEALTLLSQGFSTPVIDAEMQRAGWPVGPLALLDEVGLDVGFHVVDTLLAHFPGRIEVAKNVRTILGPNRLGRKTGKGFYLYPDGKPKVPNPEIPALIGTQGVRTAAPGDDLAERCLFAFVSEAHRCLQEGILRCADDGDVGAILGLGFPPFLGGPFHFVRTMGEAAFNKKLRWLAERWESTTLRKAGAAVESLGRQVVSPVQGVL